MTRVSTYGSVSSGIRQGLKHERAREERQGGEVRYTKSDLATRLAALVQVSFGRNKQRRENDMPVGWLGTIWWRLRTEIHSHGRFSPAQPLLRVCTFNRPPSQTVAKLFQAGQAVPCSETGSYTDLCLPVDNGIFFRPISIPSIFQIFPAKDFITAYITFFPLFFDFNFSPNPRIEFSNLNTSGFQQFFDFVSRNSSIDR